MKLSDVFLSFLVGFVLWCLYAMVYEHLVSPRSTLVKNAVGL